MSKDARRARAAALSAQADETSTNNNPFKLDTPIVLHQVSYQQYDGKDLYMFQKRSKDEEIAFLRKENEMLKAKNAKLEHEAVEAQMYMDDSTEEIDRIQKLYAEEQATSSMWQSMYEEEHEKCQKAEHERDLLKELVHDASGAKTFTMRQTAMIGYALFLKAGLLPSNKKKITSLFHGISGYSANTMGQALCSTFTDEEKEMVAQKIEKDLPEFAKCLREMPF